MNLNQNFYHNLFSHIYIEEKALSREKTQKILALFPKSKKIIIQHYKDVFSRTHQNFFYQKKSPKLILATKDNNFIYEGAPVCENFGHEHFYYTSTTMNCIYNCEYCYLQGMYSSAYVVCFVNIEDYFEEILRLLFLHPVYLCISYDTDLLALEHITKYCHSWIEFARNKKDLTIEIRTKSANISALSKLESSKNIILAWTLSPNTIIAKYEKGTPSLEKRLNSIKIALDLGWKIRLCFDPMIYHFEWKKHYKEMINYTFSILNANDIFDISLGVFRVSKDYLKKMKKHQPESSILQYPFTTKDNVATYDKPLIEKMTTFLYNELLQYVPKEKIYL